LKITGKNPYVNLDAYAKNVKDKERIDNQGKKASNQVVKEDKVVLSQEAKRVQKAKKLMESIPDIREEKIAKVKAQIENGTYQVQEKKLAAKMIKESLLNELL
jgi:negative regulator of flagellin synthesis FlgM